MDDLLATALADAIREAAVVQAKLDALQKTADERSAAATQAQSDLAAERAVSEGLRAQLATEREARAALSEPLKQAIDAAAKPPIMVPQTGAPVAYEGEIMAADGSGTRRKFSIKPVIRGG